MSLNAISGDSFRPDEPVPDYDDRGIDREESITESSEDNYEDIQHLQRDNIHFDETFPDNGENTIGLFTIVDLSHYRSQSYLQRDTRPIHTYGNFPYNGESSVATEEYITPEPSPYMSLSHLEGDYVHANDPFPHYEAISSDRDEFRWEPIQ